MVYVRICYLIMSYLYSHSHSLNAMFVLNIHMYTPVHADHSTIYVNTRSRQ